MTLVHDDVDGIIISYILNGTEKWNFQMIKRLYIIFGRSQFKNFIINSKKYFFNTLFLRYKVNTIDDFLSKSLKIKIKNLHFYHEHIKFRKNTNNKDILFESLNRKASSIVKYLSLYNDYIWICTKRNKFENLGYVYSRIHDNPEYKNKPLKYSFMRTKHIHNLDYYDLVDKADNIYDSTFRLKPNACIYKLGATKEHLDFECIKILY